MQDGRVLPHFRRDHSDEQDRQIFDHSDPVQMAGRVYNFIMAGKQRRSNSLLPPERRF